MSDSLEDQFTVLRGQMVEQIALHSAHVGPQTGRAPLSERVMATMGRVARHAFVPVELRAFAYFDTPLPIGYDKTISQPFIVALMTDLLEIEPQHRVLEIGTGLGYQAAVLADLCEHVYSVEIIEELAQSAARRLADAKAGSVTLRIGDGSGGWPEHAPFDRILVAAAPDLIPTALLHQLRPGGRMVIPAGIESAQQLMLVEKSASGQLSTREILPVRFAQLVTADSAD